METEKLLVLNAGSSSLKFTVYERNSDLKPQIRGKIERIGEVVAKCRLATDARAGEAIRLFCYEAKKRIGAYAAAMNGVDILVFSGGIGENCPSIRERICKDMSYLGLEIDDPRNDVNNKIISTTSSKVLVMVVKADEESVIAQETHQALSAIVEPSPPVQIAP